MRYLIVVIFTLFLAAPVWAQEQGTSLLDLVDAYKQAKRESLLREREANIQEQIDIISCKPVGRIGPIEGGRLVFPTKSDRENALIRLTVLAPDLAKNIRELLVATGRIYRECSNPRN